MTQLDTQTRGHHPHSPSSLQSTEACAHFTNEQRDSAASAAGVLQHKAAETRDFSILEDPAHVAAVERALQVEDWWIDQLTHVERVVGRDNEISETLHEPESVREKYFPVDASHTEYEIVLKKGEDGVEREAARHPWKGITGGYPDTVLLQRATRSAAVLDWKFGKLLVTPTRDNMQGKAYAAGVMEEYPFVDEVTVVFYHPYVEVDDEGGVSQKVEYQHTFTRAERDFIELQIRTYVARKKLARAQGLNRSEIPQVPKTDLCLWCANKAKCEALGSLMVLGASKHKEIEVPDVFNPMQLVKPEDYAQAYRFANQFELVAKEIKGRVRDAAVKEGIDVPGFKIMRRREPEIRNPGELKRLALEKYGVTEAEFEACISVPITKIDAAVKARAPKRQGAPTVRAFREEAQELGALVMGDGYLYLQEVKSEDKLAVEQKDLEI